MNWNTYEPRCLCGYANFVNSLQHGVEPPSSRKSLDRQSVATLISVTDRTSPAPEIIRQMESNPLTTQKFFPAREFDWHLAQVVSLARYLQNSTAGGWWH